VWKDVDAAFPAVWSGREAAGSRRVWQELLVEC
jgi:hypothetical protein